MQVDKEKKARCDVCKRGKRCKRRQGGENGLLFVRPQARVNNDAFQAVLNARKGRGRGEEWQMFVYLEVGGRTRTHETQGWNVIWACAKYNIRGWT